MGVPPSPKRRVPRQQEPEDAEAPFRKTSTGPGPGPGGRRERDGLRSGRRDGVVVGDNGNKESVDLTVSEAVAAVRGDAEGEAGWSITFRLSQVVTP